MLIAANEGNAEIVKILLKLGMSTNIPRNNVDAQTLAWNGRHFDVLYALAGNNLIYPKDMDFNLCAGLLKNLCDSTEQLHDFILTKNSEKVQEILNMYPKLQHFYNSKNESALKIAIQNDSIEIYEILLSQKLRFGPHENPEEYLEDLDDESKRLIEIIHNKYSITIQEKHINILIENSFICHDEIYAEKKAEYVQRAYRALNANIFIRIILMIVAASKKFKIIFDFNREAVNVLDPTTTPYTQGIFYISGRIYIGAKQLLDIETENTTLATMAHELCHFAVNIVYDNCAKPYKDGDKKTMNEFEEVSDACMEHYGKEDVVDSVFNDYPDELTHAELIVRVVHLLALYRNDPEKLVEVKALFVRLFGFYEKKVVPELETALKDMENKDKLEIEMKDKMIVKYKLITVIIGILAAVGIISAGLVVRFVFFPDYFIFNELPEVDQKKVKNATVTYKGIDVAFANIFADDSEAYDKLSSDRIVHMLNGGSLDLSNSLYHYLDELVVHDWKNMTGKFKDKVFDSSFNYQNETLRLESLKSVSPKIFESLTSDQIVQVLEGQTLNVSSMTPNDIPFYIERKFVCLSDCKGKSYINVDDVIQIAELNKMFILSSGMGSGKTEVFKKLAVKIKKKNPLQWVAYIDLKKFEDLYVNFTYSSDIENYLIQILSENQKNKFEMRILQESYRSGKVVLLWDGLDDINVEYRQFILNLMMKIQHTTNIIQALCTRLIETDEKLTRFSMPIYTLVDFDSDEIDDFLMKFFISKNEKQSNLKTHLKNSHDLIRMFTIIIEYFPLNPHPNFASPLILKFVGISILSFAEVSEWGKWDEFVMILIDAINKSEVNKIYNFIKDAKFPQRFSNAFHKTANFFKKLP